MTAASGFLTLRNTQRVLIAASAAQGNQTFNRNETGWTTRANFGFDFASNTAYGPLIGHFDLNAESGNGFDNTGGYTYLNTGYVTWAGITAGKAQSFYSFTGGGDNWANFASPDQKGFNEPDLLAYTASFGGGFTATIAAQSPGCNGGGPNATLAQQLHASWRLRRRHRPDGGHPHTTAVRSGRTSSAPCMSSRAGARRRSRA